MLPAVFRLRLRAVILAAVVAWACAGSVLWQGLRTAHYRWVRAESSACVSDTVLVTATSNAVWLEEDELRYEGRMFDVCFQKKVSGGLLLIGHFDAEDDRLFGLLHTLFDEPSREEEHESYARIFLPEAVLPSAMPEVPLSAFPPQPLRNPTQEEHWRNAHPARPDIPPEGTA